jgi:DNA-directed RNA polymerase specialized sigma24 family protein
MESLDPGSTETAAPSIIHRFAAGEDDGLTKALIRCKGGLVRAANRMIRRLGIDEADLDGEGAVNLAFFELRQTEDRNGAHAVSEDDAFFRLAWGTVRRVILQQKRRSRSVKRGGAGRLKTGRHAGQDMGATDPRPADGGFRRIEADLDQFVSQESPIEDVVDAKLEFDALVQRLPDDLHRKVLIMHDQGFSIKEIALDLDLDRKTIARKRETIERIYRKSKPGS